MDFKVAKRLTTLKLRPIMKILYRYPTLSKHKNFKNLPSLKDFAFQSQVYNTMYGEMCILTVDHHYWFSVLHVSNGLNVANYLSHEWKWFTTLSINIRWGSTVIFCTCTTQVSSSRNNGELLIMHCGTMHFGSKQFSIIFSF
jgi:hypothetical protein